MVIALRYDVAYPNQVQVHGICKYHAGCGLLQPLLRGTSWLDPIGWEA